MVAALRTMDADPAYVSGLALLMACGATIFAHS
jgi:hypothetical protein